MRWPVMLRRTHWDLYYGLLSRSLGTMIALRTRIKELEAQLEAQGEQDGTVRS